VFLRNAQGFGQVLTGLCLVGFAYGGYLALMPSFTADYYGPKHVGANYGILFSAWGLCGYLVPKYFERIMDRAKEAGDLAAGYNQVYFTLAIAAVVGAALAMVVRRPAR
jgi:MFS family permease